MPDQPSPADPKQAQDPSFAYERSHPQREAGMGRLDNNQATPANHPERGDRAVPNRQSPRGVNADEVTDERSTGRDPQNPGAGEPGSDEPGGSMFDEEPLGEDQRPTAIRNPRDQRNPRLGGKGGTPDEREPHRAG